LSNLCFLLVFKDVLFRQIMLSLLSEMQGNIQLFESNADAVEDLLVEVSKLRPDAIMLEEASPLSSASCLVHLLKVLPGRPIIVVSQEQNLLHVIRGRTVQVEQADDLIEFVRSM
jgi:hypothetical protein